MSWWKGGLKFDELGIVLGHSMQRREFITLLGVWRLRGRSPQHAQKTAKIPRLDFFLLFTPPDAAPWHYFFAEARRSRMGRWEEYRPRNNPQGHRVRSV